MAQVHKRRKSKNKYIDMVWQSKATSDGTYLVTPDGSWDLITGINPDGSRLVFIAGQATKPARLPYKAGNQSVVVSFAAGAYLTHLRGAPVTDSFVMLPLVDDEHFELGGHQFPIPTFTNAETLVDEMVSVGVLQNDSIVDGVLSGSPKASSRRSVQRHFKATTGVTHKKLDDIRRAQKAVRLLKDGADPASTAADTGYYDQAHLTKSLKKLMDSTPTDVQDVNQV